MNNKELINAGHALAKAISNDTPLIEIAKIVSNLATQLDVQLARSNQLSIGLEIAEKRIAELEAREVTPEVGVMNIGNPYCEDRLVAWTVAGRSLPPGIYYLEAVRSGSVGVED